MLRKFWTVEKSRLLAKVATHEDIVSSLENSQLLENYQSLRKISAHEKSLNYWERSQLLRIVSTIWQKYLGKMSLNDIYIIHKNKNDNFFTMKYSPKEPFSFQKRDFGGIFGKSDPLNDANRVLISWKLHTYYILFSFIS